MGASKKNKKGKQICSSDDHLSFDFDLIEFYVIFVAKKKKENQFLTNPIFILIYHLFAIATRRKWQNMWRSNRIKS